MLQKNKTPSTYSYRKNFLLQIMVWQLPHNKIFRTGMPVVACRKFRRESCPYLPDSSVNESGLNDCSISCRICLL